ncbi:MAG: aspartate/glutamate racemase family protein [Parvibaculum sp.]|uniref:aspartate/glutamate racemase family protein n=1 Tax=Parvibaculum sp. TaxID=2024848 RepID=UPI0025E80450|nr:aspartate/glutamate racemase family protein [Parvibaculum sp.]MCE9650806.1 aspartate/glutamate racemase family protein [Parvibaculum sp.]
MPPSSHRHGAAIAFLHTTAVHIETFNALGAELAPELALTHAVREDLLSAAEKVGFVTPALDLKTQEALIALADGGARVVVCTCSTLGASAEAAAEEADVPILRIDRAMADLAVETGARIGVCACIPATVPNTQTLIRSSAAQAGREIDMRTFVFDDVWTLFREGRLSDYYEGIASRLADAARDVDVLVLAQASMAPAAALCGALGVPVLSSPRIGFEVAARLARQDAR